jgi:hypothetical protein
MLHASAAEVKEQAREVVLPAARRDRVWSAKMSRAALFRPFLRTGRCRYERILVNQASQHRFREHDRTRRQSMSGFRPRKYRHFLWWIRYPRP